MALTLTKPLTKLPATFHNDKTAIAALAALQAAKPIEMAIICKGIRPLSCFGMPTTSELIESGVLSYNGFVKIIGGCILSTADYYGVRFNGGDLNALALHLVVQYQKMTVVDWCIVFDRINKGCYRTEYQNITTRGITPEFIQDWLLKYNQERSLAAIAIADAMAIKAKEDHAKAMNEAYDGFDFEAAQLVGKHKRQKLFAFENTGGAITAMAWFFYWFEISTSPFDDAIAFMNKRNNDIESAKKFLFDSIAAINKDPFNISEAECIAYVEHVKVMQELDKATLSITEFIFCLRKRLKT